MMRIEELKTELGRRDKTIEILKGQVGSLESKLAKAKRDLETATAASTAAAKLATDRQRMIGEMAQASTEERKRWQRDREVLEAHLREARDEIAKLRQRPSLSKLVGDTIRNVKGGAR